jgi:dipeptidyl aminopeptidase/acylaminoacyl peptidase
MKALYNANPSYQMLFNTFMNGTPTSNPSAYTSASPLYLVNSNTPPTIIFHGTADPLVPVSQSDSLNTRLNNAGVIHQYVKYNGEGHGWYGANLIDTYAKLAAFIKQYVQ